MKIKNILVTLGVAVAASLIVKKIQGERLLPASYAFDPDPTATANLADYSNSVVGKLSGLKQSKIA